MRLIFVVTNDTAKRLLTRVKELRKALGLSQEAFAERAGLKYKHYQALEAGRKNEFHFSTFEKLAKACGLKPCELIDFDVEPPILAEDPAENESRAPSSRPTRKAPKRGPGKKSR
ncbi:MAG: helix-turn-helix transcriptional regulator [Undibacterium sp.]|nr:helix-turn-helix transcriptional regulator [Opitutaceae bacterium]